MGDDPYTFDAWLREQYSRPYLHFTDTDMRDAWHAGAVSEKDLVLTQLGALDVKSYASAEELFATIQRRLRSSIPELSRRG